MVAGEGEAGASLVFVQPKLKIVNFFCKGSFIDTKSSKEY